MNNEKSLLIIDQLLNSKKPLKADELADSLKLSRRTVFNYMKSVKKICKQYNAELCNEKFKGYYIVNSTSLKNSLGILNFSSISQEESRLFIEYCLLSDNEYLHINELEDILHFTRPTIYKMLSEIDELFREYDIELIVERKGVIINCGEKRRRKAIRKWINEAKNFLKTQEKRGITKDYFKFEQCIKEFELLDNRKIKQLSNELSVILKVKFSKYEEENICIFLNVLLKRFNDNYITSLSTVVSKLLDGFYADECQKVHNCICNYGYDLPKAEIVYLVVTLLVCGQDFENTKLIDEEIRNKIIKGKLGEIKKYILSVLRLNNEVIDSLMDSICQIIRREFVFRVKGELDIDSTYYRRAFENYTVVIDIALDIFEIINKQFNVEYNARTISNITYACLNAIELNKRKLKTVLFHDCDYYEFKYILNKLKNIPYITIILSTDKESELKRFIKEEQVDLIISTNDYNLQSNISWKEINKNVGKKDIISLLEFIEELYQRINFEELYIKNSKQ